MLQDMTVWLKQAEDLISELEPGYERSLAGQRIQEELAAGVNRCLELLEQALNTCAEQVYRITAAGADSRPDQGSAALTYPIYQDAARFLTAIKQDYPGLIEHYPVLFRLFMSDQPFVSPASWLQELGLLLKQGFPVGLSGRQLEESRRISLLTFHGEEMDFVSPEAPLPPVSADGIAAVPWGSIHLDATGKELLQGLREAYDGVHSLVNNFQEAFRTIASEGAAGE